MRQSKNPERPIAIRVEDVSEFDRDWLRIGIVYPVEGEKYWVLANGFRIFQILSLAHICLYFEGAY